MDTRETGDEDVYAEPEKACDHAKTEDPPPYMLGS